MKSGFSQAELEFYFDWTLNQVRQFRGLTLLEGGLEERAEQMQVHLKFKRPSISENLAPLNLSSSASVEGKLQID